MMFWCFISLFRCLAFLLFSNALFGRDIFAISGTEKGHLAVSDEQMVRLEFVRR